MCKKQPSGLLLFMTSTEELCSIHSLTKKSLFHLKQSFRKNIKDCRLKASLSISREESPAELSLIL